MLIFKSHLEKSPIILVNIVHSLPCGISCSFFSIYSLEVLWAVVQNYPCSNLKQGGSDTLDQWEFKDSQESWSNVETHVEVNQ